MLAGWEESHNIMKLFFRAVGFIFPSTPGAGPVIRSWSWSLRCHYEEKGLRELRWGELVYLR